MFLKYIAPLILCIISCTNNIDDINLAYSFDSSINQASEIELSYFLDGRLDFKMHARNMTSSEHKTTFFNGFQLIAYDSTFKQTAILSSDIAVQDKDSDTIEVNNNVVLVNAKKEQLNADHLIWDKNSQQIYSDGFVTIKTDKQVIMGYGFVSDERFESYTLSNITGTIYI